MTRAEGLALASPGGTTAPASLLEVNDALERFGARVWPLDLSDVPGRLRRLLERPSLTDAERESVREHFLLPRERLVELVAGAGRTPHVRGGGETSTFDSTNGVRYPQLHLVARGADYSRFDRLHVNAAADGTGVDEVMQVLAGGPIRVVQGLPDAGAVTLYLDCPSPGRGWTISFSGATPHVASLTEAREGSKMLVQAIGPPTWSMTYLDEAGRVRS